MEFGIRMAFGQTCKGGHGFQSTMLKGFEFEIGARDQTLPSKIPEPLFNCEPAGSIPKAQPLGLRV